MSGLRLIYDDDRLADPAGSFGILVRSPVDRSPVGWPKLNSGG